MLVHINIGCKDVKFPELKFVSQERLCACYVYSLNFSDGHKKLLNNKLSLTEYTLSLNS